MITNIWRNTFILKTNITDVLIMFWSLYFNVWHVLPHLVSSSPVQQLVFIPFSDKKTEGQSGSVRPPSQEVRARI